MNVHLPSAAYWEARYSGGGGSGAGSRGRLAAYKAALVNALIADNAIVSVLDFGCGDGELLSLLDVPFYTGIDVSSTILSRCAARFADRPRCRFLPADRATEAAPAELGLSLDVIFHLVDDAAFVAHLDRLFQRSLRLVAIYASNADLAWPGTHVRHRRFTDTIAATQPGWRLLAHLPNPYPYDPRREDDTSFADFFIYGRVGRGASVEPCIIRLPGCTG